MTWRKMSSAPRDGTWVMLWCQNTIFRKDGIILACSKNGQWQSFQSVLTYPNKVQAWMPLPPIPDFDKLDD